MQQKKTYPYGVESIGRVQSRAEVDYVKDGVLYKGDSAASVLVTGQSDLNELDGYYPGTVAYTAGFQRIWHLASDGTWVEV